MVQAVAKRKPISPEQFIDGMERLGFQLTAGLDADRNPNGNITWVQPTFSLAPKEKAELHRLQEAQGIDFDISELAVELAARGLVTNEGWDTRFTNLDAAKVRAIAGELRLSGSKVETLANRLHKVRASFDLQKETVPRESAALEFLADLEKSVCRIARKTGVSTRAFRRAKSQMVVECEGWAAKQRINDLLARGFDPMPTADGTDYGSWAVIEQWFERSSVILLSLQRAKDILDFLAQPKRADGSDRAKKRLCGKVLPDLYTELTGNKFTVSNVMEPKRASTKKGVRDVGGVRFVRLALGAMGLEVLKPETIASHRKP